MLGHGAKFSRKKEAAIAALLSQPSVEQAARVVGIGPQTLRRWMRDREFAGTYRRARCATFRQAIGRLQKASGAAATMLMKAAFDPGGSRSERLAAADSILSGAKTATEIEEFGARLSEVKRVEEAPKGPIAGHGAKLPRKWEAAIVALLTQRNVEEAARVTGIGTQTLYRWMRDPEFAAACVEAKLAAFGQAGARLQQASGSAVTVILKIMADPGTSARTHVRAAKLVLKHARDASEEDIGARLSELDGERRTFDDEDLPPFTIILQARPKASMVADEPSIRSRGSVPKEPA